MLHKLIPNFIGLYYVAFYHCGMGRRKIYGMVLDRVITVKLGVDEHEDLKRLAGIFGATSVTNYVRRLILDDLKENEGKLSGLDQFINVNAYGRGALEELPRRGARATPDQVMRTQWEQGGREVPKTHQEGLDEKRRAREQGAADSEDVQLPFD